MDVLRTVFGEQRPHPALREALRGRREAFETVEDDQARLGRCGQNFAKRISDTDFALERGLRVAVDRGLSNPYAPAIVRLADLLRELDDDRGR